MHKILIKTIFWGVPVIGSFVAIASWRGIARADTRAAEAGPTVDGSSSCPAPAQVARALTELTSVDRLQKLSPAARITISDEGDRYSVTVVTGLDPNGAAIRTYDESGRDCARRARTAALFAVLVLMPPELESEVIPRPEPAPTPKESPTAEGATPPPVQSRPDSLVRLEGGAIAEASLGSSNTAWGAEGRAVIGSARFGAVIGAGYSPVTTLVTGDVRTAFSRLPIVLGFRTRESFGPIELAGDVSLVGSIERLRGTNLLHPEAHGAFDVGGLIGLQLSLTSLRVGPFLRLYQSIFPRPTEIQAFPAGTAGRVPKTWTGVSLGVALAL